MPNPAVHQAEDRPIQTRTMTLTLNEGQQTEIKTVLQESKVIVYHWQTDGGLVYSDLHGHDPAAGGEFFVRYREDQDGAPAPRARSLRHSPASTAGTGSTSHDGPVTITLTVTGFFDDIIDYGIL